MSDGYSSDGPENEAGEQGGFQVDLLKSYLAFGWRGIRARWPLAAALFVVGLTLSVLASIYAPRTYTCKTVLMAVGNPILDGNNGGGNPLAGAVSLIKRHENLEHIVRDTGLVEKFPTRRPPLLRLKDKLIMGLFGKLDAAMQLSILVATVESRLDVDIDQSGNLEISVDWGDGKTAAELAEAAREGFIKNRHNAEVSAFEAKMSILDEHATKLRSEVENLAQQINSAQEERAALATKTTPGNAAPSPVMRALSRAVASSPAETGTPLPELKDKLADMKRKLTDMEADRDHRIRDEEAKLSELKLRFTPSHPQVVTQEERVAMVSQVPSELALLRSEVADLDGNIKEREVLAGHGSGALVTASSGGAAAGAPALPQEIVRALENDKTDPALSAQLSGAVVKYGQLRDDIRSGRIELDTAQAAFDHRYQVVVPADPPLKPTKPKPGVVFGAGFVLSLLVSLLLPILFQLRNGLMIERWQVHQLQLPVLAELRLPPHSTD